MTHQVILGHPWLMKHNPNFGRVKGQVSFWVDTCKESCFLQPVSTTVSCPDLKRVPACYHDLALVFNEAKAKLALMIAA